MALVYDPKTTEVDLSSDQITADQVIARVNRNNEALNRRYFVLSASRSAESVHEINADIHWSLWRNSVQFEWHYCVVVILTNGMNRAIRTLFKILATVFFLLAIASVLATLITAPDSSGSPGLFLAIVLAGFAKWLLGKSQGKSARETFGRAVEVAETRDVPPE